MRRPACPAAPSTLPSADEAGCFPAGGKNRSPRWGAAPPPLHHPGVADAAARVQLASLSEQYRPPVRPYPAEISRRRGMTGLVLASLVFWRRCPHRRPRRADQRGGGTRLDRLPAAPHPPARSQAARPRREHHHLRRRMAPRTDLHPARSRSAADLPVRCRRHSGRQVLRPPDYQGQAHRQPPPPRPHPARTEQVAIARQTSEGGAARPDAGAGHRTAAAAGRGPLGRAAAAPVVELAGMSARCDFTVEQVAVKAASRGTARSGRTWWCGWRVGKN